MDELKSISQKIQSKKAQLYQIEKASEGHPVYIKAYPNKERRARKSIALCKELNDLKAARLKLGNELGVKFKPKGGRPNGYMTPIVYQDSLGNTWTQKEIDKKRSEAYRQTYEGNPHPRCTETGLRAQCSSHIISQKRCKQLHKTELIWNPINFFPATFEVNSRWESNDTTLPNYKKYMQVVKMYDPEGYEKRLNFSNETI